MNEVLEDTGERLIPEKMKITNELLIEHVARYHFALAYINKGRVLDFACGSGFGTHIIAKKKKKQVDEVVGVDIDLDCLDYAKHNYYHPKSTFLQADVTVEDLKEKLGLFDTIVSFETYEHIAEEKKFLDNVYTLLKPGGQLILSTPFGQGRGVPCGSPFHVHQITPNEFKQLFNSYNYHSVTYYVQKGALIEPAETACHDYYPLGIAVCVK